MNKIVIIITLIISTIFSASAKITPPAAVSKAFKTQFANATDIKWGKENATEYEAEFMQDGVKHSANFSSKGKWIETETAIKYSEIPKAVQASFETAHKGTKKKEIAKIEKANGTIIYEIEITIGGKNKDCLYNEDGSIYNG
jgi:uncharacterized membrane protein YkoI